MGGQSVLIVDDEEDVAKGFARVLELAGFETAYARDGAEAARKLDERAYDVMLTDLFMPEKEGLETIREAHMLYPDMRIVAVSGGFGDGSASRWLQIAQKFGASMALPKPVHSADLLRAIRGDGQP